MIDRRKYWVRFFMGVFLRMESFSQVHEDTKEKLGRELKENELEFLCWVYQRYSEEQQHVST